MVEVFGNRTWILDEDKHWIEDRNRVKVILKRMKDGSLIYSVHTSILGNKLTKNELLQCIKILDYIEKEDKKLNGLLK